MALSSRRRNSHSTRNTTNSSSATIVPDKYVRTERPIHGRNAQTVPTVAAFIRTDAALYAAVRSSMRKKDRRMDSIERRRIKADAKQSRVASGPSIKCFSRNFTATRKTSVMATAMAATPKSMVE